MQACNGDTGIALSNFDICIERMKSHMIADELVRGTGFDGKKGCAVGCTFDNYNHSLAPVYLDMPEWLIRLDDALFEGMSFEKSKNFPLLFLEETRAAVERNADLEKVKAPFLIYILEGVLDNFDHVKFPDVLKCIQDVIELYRSGETDLNKFEAARAAAAEAAAWAAAWAVARAATRAEAAAWAVARAAAEAAAAGAAARAAAWAAAWATRAVARAAAEAYDRYADKLLELIKNC